MHLVLANEAQKKTRDLVTFEAWGERLDLEGFLQREARLRVHPWAKQAMATWFLCAEDGDVLSSCETFQMQSFLHGKDPGTTYGVASVFTARKHRGHHFAQALLERVSARLGQEDPEVQALILFSDVPPRIYEATGYALRPALHRVRDAVSGNPAEGVDRLLSRADVPEYLGTIPLSRDAFVVWPTSGQLDWHLERESIYAELLGVAKSQACGAVAGDAVAFWTADFKNGHLNVLLLESRTAEGTRTLLNAACKSAHETGLGTVHWWEEYVATDPAACSDWGTQEDRRDACESLPMIRPLDSRIQASHWRRIPKGIWV